MTNSNLDETNLNEEFHKTFEFKGKELHPFSEGRRALIFSLVGNLEEPNIFDLHAIIFACLSDKKTLIKARRNKEWFDALVFDWAEKNITQEDYEQEGILVRDLIANAFSTKAEPVPDDGTGDLDPLGNGQSRQTVQV